MRIAIMAITTNSSISVNPNLRSLRLNMTKAPQMRWDGEGGERLDRCEGTRKLVGQQVYYPGSPIHEKHGTRVLLELPTNSRAQ